MSTNKTLVMSAHCTDDYQAGPSLATVHSPDQLLLRVKELQKLAADNDLSELRVYSGCDWGPYGYEEEARLTCGELVVTPVGFWFLDNPKNASYTVESTVIYTEDLEKALASDDDTIYLGNEIEDLKESHQDYLEAREAAEKDLAAEIE